MMRIFVSTITIVWLASLTACSNAVSVNYYQLNASQALTVNNEVTKPIYIQPVQVASYLNSKSIVMQMSEVELVLARQHLWADPLDQQIQRQLANNLDATSHSYSVALQPNNEAIQLTVYIEQFHGTAKGHALIKGRFSLKQPETNITQHHFAYQLPLEADGYAALIYSLSQGLEFLAADIFQQLPSETAD